VNASGDVRVGVGGRAHATGGLDAARVDLSGRPLPRLLVSGGFRYWGLRLPDVTAAGLYPWPERRADASAGWDFGPVVVSALGGFARDLATDLGRRFAGPEVSLPRLFRARGGLTLGYLEERGWVDGRSAFAQAVLRPLARVRVTARLYWAADVRPDSPDDQEAGLFLAAGAELSRRVSVRASVLARAGARGATNPSRSTGVEGTVGLAGAL
jgi:hypothetical protein